MNMLSGTTIESISPKKIAKLKEFIALYFKEPHATISHFWRKAEKESEKLFSLICTLGISEFRKLVREITGHAFAPKKYCLEEVIAHVKALIALEEWEGAVLWAKAWLEAEGEHATVMIFENCYAKQNQEKAWGYATCLHIRMFGKNKELPTLLNLGAETQPTPQREPLVLLVGGLGTSSHDYKNIALTFGRKLRHIENALHELVGLKHSRIKIEVIIIMVNNVSHSLRDCAVEIAFQSSTPVIYLKSNSTTGLKKALQRFCNKSK